MHHSRRPVRQCMLPFNVVMCNHDCLCMAQAKTASISANCRSKQCYLQFICYQCVLSIGPVQLTVTALFMISSSSLLPSSCKMRGWWKLRSSRMRIRISVCRKKETKMFLVIPVSSIKLQRFLWNSVTTVFWINFLQNDKNIFHLTRIMSSTSTLWNNTHRKRATIELYVTGRNSRNHSTWTADCITGTRHTL